MKLAYKLNHLFLYTVNKFPNLFSRRFQLVAEHHFYLERKRQESEGIITTSLFNPILNWQAKGVHLLIRVSSKDVIQIQKWQNKKDPLHLNQRYNVKVSSEHYSWNNLGIFSVKNRNTRTYGDHKLNVNSKYFESCSAFTSSMSGGVFFLSLYLTCKNEATAVLKDIDCSTLKNERIYHCLNPFSKHYGTCSHSKEYRQGINLLQENLKVIYNDAFNIGSDVVQCLGLKRDIASNPISCFDFWLNSNECYETLCDEGKDKKHYFALDDVAIRFSDSIMSRKEYIFECSPHLLEYQFGSLYLKSECSELNKENIFSYKDTFCHVDESHNVLSYLFYLSKRYRSVHEYHEKILTSNYSVNHTYDEYHKLSLKINELKKVIKSIKTYCTNTFEYSETQEYLLVIQKKTKDLTKKISEFEIEIDKEKKILNERIQSENLRYHILYSKIIFGLVIFQIIIGLLTIDWDKVSSWL